MRAGGGLGTRKEEGEGQRKAERGEGGRFRRSERRERVKRDCGAGGTREKRGGGWKRDPRERPVAVGLTLILRRNHRGFFET